MHLKKLTLRSHEQSRAQFKNYVQSRENRNIPGLIGAISLKLTSILPLVIILSSHPWDMTTHKKQSTSVRYACIDDKPWIVDIISLSFKFSQSINSNSKYSKFVLKLSTSVSDQTIFLYLLPKLCLSFLIIHLIFDYS